MNTKTLLFITFFILFVPAKVSIGNNTQGTQKHTQMADNHQELSGVDLNDNSAIPWGIAIPNNYTQSNHTNHNSDDDGKSHHFHYNRLQKRRCKSIFCFIAKIILLITHVCSFLAIYSHVTH